MGRLRRWLHRYPAYGFSRPNTLRATLVNLAVLVLVIVAVVIGSG